MHKKHKRRNNYKEKKQEPSFLYATHRHDLFCIIVKYHQNIPNGIQVFERTRKCLRTDGETTDGRHSHRFIPNTFGRGIIKLNNFLVKKVEKATFVCQKT